MDCKDPSLFTESPWGFNSYYSYSYYFNSDFLSFRYSFQSSLISKLTAKHIGSFVINHCTITEVSNYFCMKTTLNIESESY